MGAIHKQTEVAFRIFVFTNVHIMEITKTTIGPINEGELGFLCKKYLSLYCYVGVFTICHQAIHIMCLSLSFKTFLWKIIEMSMTLLWKIMTISYYFGTSYYIYRIKMNIISFIIIFLFIFCQTMKIFLIEISITRQTWLQLLFVKLLNARQNDRMIVIRQICSIIFGDSLISLLLLIHYWIPVSTKTYQFEMI